ncbi:ATP-binding cassette domain-containing protein [Corynebacterium felinum]|uniref:ABC-type dipeptide/oligopeptide/nickel transport system ATPase subunit n=1 Tax=Corynebacterium felinum TaxID=131318 RepID=A0ABU2BDE6_9CORY|nr:ATP-binding cassette domain-containing protein [Corynebacterium felinum]MDF5819878.1 ATP-binding cassette domain-containing protein [Corynebacterium felinum]MDR7355979.1 ABC-type dipeptide/oligopeptide/nickel transport system ATPase subunit [Corynebacterium felinum]WJY95315.1 Methionine import ATP-binding protein MetN 2 [Corynebacterium felinum]
MNALNAEPATTTPVYSCTDVEVSYSGTCVLSIPELSIFPGEAIAVLGPSGAGKSTLAAVVGGFLDPLATLQQQSPPNETRTLSVGVVGQDAFGALNPLARVDKQLALTAGSLSRARELLRSVDIDDHLHSRYPLALSGGQRQRASIAFALGGDPDIVICDEVTSALDPVATVTVIETLQRLLATNPKRAVLFISHDHHAAHALCHRAIVLNPNPAGGFRADVKEAGQW